MSQMGHLSHWLPFVFGVCECRFARHRYVSRDPLMGIPLADVRARGCALEFPPVDVCLS